MQNFFVEPSQIRDNKIFMEGKDVNHIKNVLRMKPGEDIRITDGNGSLYLCCIEKYENGGAFLDYKRNLGRYRTSVQDLPVSGASQRG